MGAMIWVCSHVNCDRYLFVLVLSDGVQETTIGCRIVDAKTTGIFQLLKLNGEVVKHLIEGIRITQSSPRLKSKKKG